MKKIPLGLVLFFGLILNSCIGEDIIDDAVPEEIRFLNPTGSIAASESYQLDVRFFNNIGEPQDVDIIWSSEDLSIATVNATGLVTGVSEGSTNIKAEALIDNKTIVNKIPITITPDISGPKSQEIVVLNPTQSVAVSDTYLFEVVYYNASGKEEDVNITWISENPAILSVNTSGLITGVTEGTTTVKAQTVVNNEIVENAIIITVTEAEDNSKSGTIITTSSYALSGTFTISEIENTNNLFLDIDNYNASTSLPGLYIYLSNNPNSIGSALEIGPVSVFNGSHSYTINNVGINDYSYVLYWCKPFGVKVGEGQINN